MKKNAVYITDSQWFEAGALKNPITAEDHTLKEHFPEFYSVSYDLRILAAKTPTMQEKSKLRRMIDAIVGKSFLIVCVLSAITALLWGAFVIFGDSEDKVRISVISALLPVIMYIFTRFSFRMIIKNPITPSKYVDFLFVFLTVCFSLGFFMLIITYFFEFPNMFSPTFTCVVAAFAGLTKSLKKRI